MAAMTVTREGRELLIRIQVGAPPTVPLSRSGKVLLLASTHGWLETKATYDGKPIMLSLNAFVHKGKPRGKCSKCGRGSKC